MIELIDSAGKVTRFHELVICDKGHPPIVFDRKPKGADQLAPCPVCFPAPKARSNAAPAAPHQHQSAHP